MKILGILVILNSLALTGWWLTGNNPYKTWVVILCGIAIVVGFIFVLQDRVIEISNKWIGTIKTAAKQATTDANEIKVIKERIESQSATVDLVAQSAAEVRKITNEVAQKNEEIGKKVEELNILTSKATGKLQELEDVTEFSKVALAAQNDDRYAFDKLVSWGGSKTYKLWELAANAVIKIRTDYNGPIEPGNQRIEWREGVDPLKLSIEQIRTDYSTSLALYHTDFVKYVEKNTSISKKEKMQFYIDILDKDASLNATFYAGKYFIKEANDPKLKWAPFYTKPILDWWKQNKIAYEDIVGK